MSNYNGVFKPGKKNSNWNLAFELIKPNSQVLDVGCSKGNFGEALIKLKKCMVDGVEPDKGDATEAKKRLTNVHNQNLENYLTSVTTDDKYDYVVFLDVIEHLYQPAETLNRLKGILRPSGKIIFSLPNMAHLSVRLMLLGGDFEYGKTGLLDNTHLHYYTAKEITRVFNEAGYTIDTLMPVFIPYADEMLDKEIELAGLEPSNKLREILRSNNGEVYQLVGSARSGKVTVTERVFSSPNPKRLLNQMIKQEVDEVRERYEADNKKLLNKLTEKQAAIERRDAELYKMKQQSQQMLRTRITNKGRKK